MICELRSTGTQTVFPGSIHPSGERIEWHNDGEPAVVAPGLLTAAIEALAIEVEKRTGATKSAPHCNGHDVPLPADVADRARKYLAKVPPAVSGQGGHDQTFSAACVLIQGFALYRGPVLELLREWNQSCQPPWSDTDLEHKIKDALEQPGKRGYLLGGDGEHKAKRQRKAKPIIIGEPASLDLREASARTDISNARRFVAKHGRDVRYCDEWSKWFVWNGKAWPIDNERRVEAAAKQVADEIWRDVAKLLPEVDRDTGDELVRFARSTASSWGIGAMLSLLRSEPGIPIQPDKLDTDPMALNVQNGTLDLRTVTLREHRREDLLTKIAPVAYDPTAECPTWHKTVREIFAGVERMIQYVQCLAGYSITGSVRDHVLPFLYGVGANGKSTLLNCAAGHAGNRLRRQSRTRFVAHQERRNAPNRVRRFVR